MRPDNEAQGAGEPNVVYSLRLVEPSVRFRFDSERLGGTWNGERVAVKRARSQEQLAAARVEMWLSNHECYSTSPAPSDRDSI
jgi:hypothetical protein